MIKETITIPTITITGYTSAPFVFAWNSYCFSTLSASRASTLSNIPAASPERTSAMYTFENTFGCFTSASPNELPPSTSRSREVMTFCMAGRLCCCKIPKDSVKVNPEVIMVESWRVKFTRSADFTLSSSAPKSPKKELYAFSKEIMNSSFSLSMAAACTAFAASIRPLILSPAGVCTLYKKTGISFL